MIVTSARHCNRQAVSRAHHNRRFFSVQNTADAGNGRIGEQAGLKDALGCCWWRRKNQFVVVTAGKRCLMLTRNSKRRQYWRERYALPFDFCGNTASRQDVIQIGKETV